MQLNTTQLAKELNLSKGRISQLVSGGQLDGCWTGKGRDRRFDLEKCATALQRKLDQGQMLGNGADTRKRIDAIKGAAAPSQPMPRDSAPLSGSDPDRYKLAQTQKAEEEARRLRRMNAEAEGTVVLASEAHQQAARQIAQEIAQFETMLRDSARAIADKMGIDFLEVRKILTDQWREHRSVRSGEKAAESDAADMTDAEREADF